MCPCLGGHIDAAPASLDDEGFGRWAFRGSITQRQHLLSYASRFVLPLTCKAGFRLAGWPLPGGCRTLWTAAKGFRSHDHPPLLTLQGPPLRLRWQHVRCTLDSRRLAAKPKSAA